jgi:hypothetical protein
MDVTANTSGGYDGNYTIGINAPTGINDPVTNAEGYALGQNYPNPFNPSTKISYTIPAAMNVKLQVYDGFGREVLTMVNKRQQAGTHEINF